MMHVKNRNYQRRSEQKRKWKKIKQPDNGLQERQD